MADIGQILDVLAGAIVTALFADTPYTIGTVAVSPVTDKTVRIYPGWPSSSNLDADLAAGVTNIGVYPTEMVRPLDPFFYDWETLSVTPLQITGTVATNTLTMTGTATSGQLYGIGNGHHGYSVRIAANESLNSSLQRLGALIPGATVNNNVLTLPTGINFTTQFYSKLSSTTAYYVSGTDTTMYQQLGRQEQVFGIYIRAPDPFTRNVVGAAMKLGLDQVRYLTTPDTLSTGKPKFMGTTLDDVPENAGLWVRTDQYEVNYPSTLIKVYPPMLFVGGHVDNGVTANVPTRALYGHL